MALGHTVLDFAAEGAVIASRIDLLILHKRSFGNQVGELLVGKKVIVYAIDLSGTRLAVSGRHGEFHIQFPAVHYVTDYGGLTAARRRGYDYKFSCHI